MHCSKAKKPNLQEEDLETVKYWGFKYNSNISTFVVFDIWLHYEDTALFCPW